MKVYGRTQVCLQVYEPFQAHLFKLNEVHLVRGVADSTLQTARDCLAREGDVPV